jgi:hypothetical protein
VTQSIVGDAKYLCRPSLSFVVNISNKPRYVHSRAKQGIQILGSYGPSSYSLNRSFKLNANFKLQPLMQQKLLTTEDVRKSVSDF